MNCHNFRFRFEGLAFLVLCTVAPSAAQVPIRLHPDNPHYFQYESKPAVLITAGEHYGSVLNLRFEYVPYLDELKKYGLNLTRTFSGAYREDGVNPHGGSPLSPGRGPDNFIAPWAWSDTEGGYDGRRFDLDRWNPDYFSRLKSFLAAARERGVVVELVLFCRMYSDEHHWRVSPLHPDNNRQGEAWRGLSHERFLTLDNEALVERQKAFTRKIVTELRDAPNVYFEIANEPGSGPIDGDFAKDIHDWHEAIISEIVAAEAGLPPARRHLIAYNDHYSAGAGIGRIPSEGSVDILNVHYLPKLAEALAEYGKGKALALDETRWISHPRFSEYGNTMKPVSGRAEAWEFLLGGGAVYSNLNYAYQVDNPKGATAESDEFKGYLKSLKSFVEGFDFVRMRPDDGVIAAGLPDGSIARAISEAGKQYGVYVHHSTYAAGRRRYEVSDEPRRLEPTLDLPPGAYHLEWVRPADLSVLASQGIAGHPGGRITLASSPEYRGDIAIRIRSR